MFRRDGKEKVDDGQKEKPEDLSKDLKLEITLNELTEKLSHLQTQYQDIYQSEEDAAAEEFRKISEKYEKIAQQLQEIDKERMTIKARWDEAQKQSKNIVRQINEIKSNIDKNRKRLGMEELYQEKVDQKEFIIFKKDKFDDDKKEKESKITEPNMDEKKGKIKKKIGKIREK